MVTEHPDTTAARADRRVMYLSYGFSDGQADTLATSRDGLFPLHHLKVKRALDAGASHAQVIEWYGPL